MQIDVELEVHWVRKYAAEIGVLLLVLGVVVLAVAVWSAARSTNSQTISQHPIISLWTGYVDVSKPWQSTGIAVKHDMTLIVNEYAVGCVRWASDVTDSRGVCVGPEGAPWTPLDLFKAYQSKTQLDDFPLPNANCGSLLMRIGGHVYSVGTYSSTMLKIAEDGNVEFAANIRQHYLSVASGKFHVEVKEWK